MAQRVVLAALVLAFLMATATAAHGKTVWLCAPGVPHDPCTASRAATVLGPGGTARVERSATPRRRPSIDCFYVYPTVSGQTGPVADRTIGPEERAMAQQQASRFASACRVFAPVYRQVTLNGVFGKAPTAAQAARGPADVRAAWDDYLAHDNHGRGVVLIGHGPGAAILATLIATRIDRRPALRRRLVSALLIGDGVTVRSGADVGGSFAHVPACRRLGQLGCVIAYSAFDAPPPATARFGVVRGAAASTRQALCVNPAALAGGPGALAPYLPSARFPGMLGLAVSVVPRVSTPWAAFPGLYTARCVRSGAASWLQVDHASGDARPVLAPTMGADWGLHFDDVTLALGNLVADVQAQSRAYAARAK